MKKSSLFPKDCEKTSSNDQQQNLYDNISSTNTTTSSTDLSDFISNSSTSTSGNTATTNTNSSSNNNSNNNSNQLNGQDSFPAAAGGKYKHFTSILSFSTPLFFFCCLLKEQLFNALYKFYSFFFRCFENYSNFSRTVNC